MTEREFEEDIRGWMRGALYSFSAAPPLPEELADVDFTTLPDELLIPVLRGTGLCIPRGANHRALDLDWELLVAYEGKPVEVPRLFIGGDRDVVTIWARDALPTRGRWSRRCVST